MEVPLRERTFGDLFGLVFSLALAHFPKLFVILAVFSLPSLAFSFEYGMVDPGDPLATEPIAPEELLEFYSSFFVTILLAIIAAALAQGAGILLVAGSFTGNKVTIGECFGAAFRRFVPLIGYSILFSLICGIGFAFCVVPGVIFFSMFALGVPAIMVERIGATAAMTRSRDLTAGHRWQVIGMYFLMNLVVGVLSIVISMLVMAPFLMSEGSMAAPTLIIWVLQVAVQTITVVIPVALYFNLRVIKEGFDISQLTAMVDEIGRRAGRG